MELVVYFRGPEKYMIYQGELSNKLLVFILKIGPQIVTTYVSDSDCSSK